MLALPATARYQVINTAVLWHTNRGKYTHTHGHTRIPNTYGLRFQTVCRLLQSSFQKYFLWAIDIQYLFLNIPVGLAETMYDLAC